MIDFEIDIPKVNLDFMNEDHKQATEITNRLINLANQPEIDKKAINDTLNSLLLHCRQHFQREEVQMQHFNFPAYDCHKGEHERVLKEIEGELQAWQESTDLNHLKYYVQTTLTNWLINHINTMDTITARFIASAGGPT